MSLYRIKSVSLRPKTVYMKKYIIITIAAFAVFAIAFGGYKSYKASQYEKNRKEFVVQANKATGLYITMCEGIRQVWYDYIFEDKKYYDPEDGTFLNGRTFRANKEEIYCSDFSEAIQKRMEWYAEKLTPEMREPFVEARRLYKAMTPPPGKFEETHKYVKQMFKAMDKLKEYAENPTGNYREYASSCNECVEEYTSALKDLEIESDIE